MLAFLAFSFCFPFLGKVWDGVIWKKDIWGLFWDHTQWHVEMGERWVTIPWAGPAHRFWLAGWWRWCHCRSWQFGARCAASCPSWFESLSCWHGNRAAGGLAAVGTCSPSRGGSEGFLRLRDGQKKSYIYIQQALTTVYVLTSTVILSKSFVLFSRNRGRTVATISEWKPLSRTERQQKRHRDRERQNAGFCYSGCQKWGYVSKRSYNGKSTSLLNIRLLLSLITCFYAKFWFTELCCFMNCHYLHILPG